MPCFSSLFSNVHFQLRVPAGATLSLAAGLLRLPAAVTAFHTSLVFDDLDTLEERWWEICRLPLSWDSSVFPGEGIWGESLRGEVAFALHQVASLPSDMWRWVLTPITPQRRRFSGLPAVLSLRSVFPRCPLWTQVCAPGVGVLTPVPEAQRPQKLFYIGEFAFFLHLCL